jgi:hypothetical protein
MSNIPRAVTCVLVAILASDANIAVAQTAPDHANGGSATSAPLGCIDVNALTTRNTPVEMYAAVRNCIGDHQFSRAARLFAIAGV